MADKDIELLINSTRAFAVSLNHEYTMSEHMLYLVMQIHDFQNIMKDYGVDIESLMSDIDHYLAHRVPKSERDSDAPLSYLMERVMANARQNVLMSGRSSSSMTVFDILLAMMAEKRSFTYYVLKKHGVSRDKFLKHMKKRQMNQMREQESAQQAEEVLSEFTTNLNELAENEMIDPVIGREDELAEISQVLARRSKNNVIMVGDPGVGKTAIAEGLALNIINGDVPEYIKNATVYSLEVGKLLAGTSYRGQFEERVKEVIEAITAQDNAILFIDEAHTMRGAGAGQAGGTDMANMLKPELAKGNLKVIASTTWEEYADGFEKDRALMRRFNRVNIDEPKPEIAKRIVTAIKPYYEKFHNAKISDVACDVAVDFSMRYQPTKRLPDKAFDLIDSACAKQRQRGVKKPVVDRSEILAELSRQTGIPIDSMDRNEEATNVLDVGEQIKEMVFGQDEVIDKILEQVYVSKAGLGEPNKPIGSYILIGPTGVGKTEVAKQMSSQLDMPLLRYDMSEYQEKHTVARLIGAPPGYVGFEDANLGGGLLIRDIDRNPYSVILFDEIEKAHPDVVDVLLQMLDEGFITSANGKRADCRNTLILMTSNLGAAEAEKNSIGFGSLERTGDQDEAVKTFFRPEFRNRVTAICSFNKLDKIDQRKIVGRLIQELRDQLASEKEIDLFVDEPSMDLILDKGFDPKMGGRPLKRTINEMLRVPISKKILLDKLSKGAKISVHRNGDQLELDYVDAKKTHRSLYEEAVS